MLLKCCHAVAATHGAAKVRLSKVVKDQDKDKDKTYKNTQNNNFKMPLGLSRTWAISRQTKMEILCE